MKTRLALNFFVCLILLLSACAQTAETDASSPPPPAPVKPVISESPTGTPLNPEGEVSSISQVGIHFLPVRADLASAARIVIPLTGRPVWIAGIPFQNGSAWAVAFEDGNLQAFLATLDGYTTLAISPGQISPGMPLTIYSQGEKLFALIAPQADASPLSPPVLLDPLLPKIAYIATNGDLVIRQNERETRLPVNALLDSRILTDEHGRLLLLSNPTERYTHGVLGDKFEAAGITLVETNPEIRIVQAIAIPEPDVIEGISPIWTDMNNDGKNEIVVTLSNIPDGARIVAFHEDGRLLAEGPAVGTGFRWRHQLVLAPFDKSGENLLAVVRTPHIGGVLEFYRLNGNQLEIMTEIPGISTHSIGSRNLFTAQAGDFDNDGEIELLAPDQAHTRLGLTGVNGEITWLDLDAELVSNLAAATLADAERVVLAAGLSNNTLQIWLP